MTKASWMKGKINEAVSKETLGEQMTEDENKTFPSTTYDITIISGTR